jgi:hypothetical protein
MTSTKKTRTKSASGIPELEKMNPTEVPDGEWLYSERKRGAYPKTTSRSGKWLIFVHVDQVDAAWRKVRLANEKGLLGDRARVSTGRNPNPLVQDPNARVIGIYTYDWKDKKDVMRVRGELRKLGFIDILNYKTDSDTMAGNYSENAGYKVNKYSA